MLILQVHETFECQECDKKFISANQLKRHMITHSGNTQNDTNLYIMCYIFSVYSVLPELLSYRRLNKLVLCCPWLFKQVVDCKETI